MTTIEDLALFRTPKDLCVLVEPDRLQIPGDAFFNESARGLHQKLREAWVLARLGVILDRLIAPVAISIVDAPMLDGLIRFPDQRIWEFEDVMVLKPGRRLGEDYRSGRRPATHISDHSGAPSDPTWIRDPILKKVEKAKKRGVRRHLVGYLNYPGGVPDDVQIAEIIRDAEDAFDTTWLLTGGTFCLLFGARRVHAAARELVGSAGLSKDLERAMAREWCSYVEWLPAECQP